MGGCPKRRNRRVQFARVDEGSGINFGGEDKVETRAIERETSSDTQDKENESCVRVTQEKDEESGAGGNFWFMQDMGKWDM